MSSDSFHVPLDEAQDPLVIALDVGSTASRGGIYDATGTPVGKRHKVAHAFASAPDGTSTIDPDQVVRELTDVLDALVAQLGSRRAAGVAIDTFASSVVGIDAEGEPLTPCITYADARCRDQVTALRAELDEAAVQQRTGTRLHTSYLAPRLSWVRATDPQTARRARRWVSLGEYVWLRLIGVAEPGTSTAAWTGLLDRRTGEWDPELLAVAGTTPEQLGRPTEPSSTLEPVTAVGGRWPALGSARWFAPITDGFASNLGTGARDAGTVVASLATSGAMRVLVDGAPDRLPAGLWNYRVDAHRSLLGGALNDVGRAVTWARETLRLPDDQAGLDAILRAAPQDDTPLVLPFLTGERSTGWAGGARATFTGVTVAHEGPALFRGLAEGVALTYGRLAAQLQEAAGEPARILASGRVGQELPGLWGLLAHAVDIPVTPVTIKRATLRGTALHSLEVLAPTVPRSMPTTGETERPEPASVAHLARRAEEFERVYSVVV